MVTFRRPLRDYRGQDGQSNPSRQLRMHQVSQRVSNKSSETVRGELVEP